MLIDDARLNELTGNILACAIEVHRVLGPGLLESTYAACVGLELTARGRPFTREQPIAITYKDLRIEGAYRADLLVADVVVVEIKCVEVLAPVHKAQLVTCMRLAKKPAGLLINFHVARLMDGV